MRCAALALAVSATACGRIGFDSLATGDGSSMNPDAANVVFVSSRRITPGQLGSLSIADEACNDEAHAAGLTGDYVAWLSWTTASAPSRLGTARGWRRVDGVAVADTITDIISDAMWAPPDRDIDGTKIDELIATGTLANAKVGQTCGDGASTAGNVTAGLPSSTTYRFTDYAYVPMSCATPSRMYCFGVSANVAVAKPVPTVGKRMFLAMGFRGDSGLSGPGGDAACNTAAANAGLTGNYKTFLTEGGLPAAQKFNSLAGPVVRPDGLVVATTVGQLVAGNLLTSATLTGDGSIYPGEVWAGSPSPEADTNGPNSCQSWSSGNVSIDGIIGDTGAVGVGFFGTDELNQTPATSCFDVRPIYCLEQ